MPRRPPREGDLFDETGHSKPDAIDSGDRAVATEVNPNVLRWARETAGVEMQTLARRFPKLDSWERGVSTPTVSQLEALSDLYRRPLAIFFLSSTPEEPPPPRDFRLLSRDQSRALSKNTRLAMRVARRAQRVYTTLTPDAQVNTPPSPRLHLNDDVEQQATAIRQHLGVTLNEQRSWSDDYAAWRGWRAAVEGLGVLVLQQTMPVNEVRGFSLNGGPIPTIVVSSSDAVLARIFTLFHELAHLLLNTVGMCLPHPDQESSTVDIEPFCNRFSGSLLIPFALLDADPALSSLHERVADHEVDRRIQKAAKDYKVSRFVILFRLLAADTLSQSRVRRLLDLWNREPTRPSKSGPQPPANKALNQYGARFVAAVLDAQTRNAISASDAAHYLSLKIKHFPTLARLVSTYGRG